MSTNINTKTSTVDYSIPSLAIESNKENIKENDNINSKENYLEENKTIKNALINSNIHGNSNLKQFNLVTSTVQKKEQINNYAKEKNNYEKEKRNIKKKEDYENDKIFNEKVLSKKEISKLNVNNSSKGNSINDNSCDKENSHDNKNENKNKESNNNNKYSKDNKNNKKDKLNIINSNTSEVEEKNKKEVIHEIIEENEIEEKKIYPIRKRKRVELYSSVQYGQYGKPKNVTKKFDYPILIDDDKKVKKEKSKGTERILNNNNSNNDNNNKNKKQNELLMKNEKINDNSKTTRSNNKGKKNNKKNKNKHSIDYKTTSIKIRNIFESLPVFLDKNQKKMKKLEDIKFNISSKNIVNDYENVIEIESENENEIESQSESEEISNEKESEDLSFNDVILINDEETVKEDPSSIKDGELDDFMEETLYKYISNNDNNNKSHLNLKPHMDIMRFLKNPVKHYPYYKLKKRDYFYICTDTPLSIKKNYMACGFYSKEYRLGIKRRRLISSSDEIEHIEDVKKNFKFPTITYYGNYILNEPIDFKLPIDIYLLVKHPYFKKMLQSVPTRSPHYFKEISQNIYLEGKINKKNEVNLCECKDGDNCGEFCLNRELFIECNPLLCNCRNRCTNQRFQRYHGVSKYLKVFWAGSKGYGLKTEKPIKKDKLIIEYTGEVISLKTCMERLNTIYKDMKSFYFINYDDGKVIDACQKGSIARFANHSCDPNCCIERWIVNNEIRVGLFALRDIKAGEELLYDYKFFSFGEKQKCYCGSKNCCGSIDFIESNNDKKKLKKNTKTKCHLNKINLADKNYWDMKHKWETLIDSLKDIIRCQGNEDFNYNNKKYVFLSRNLKNANKKLIKQTIFDNDDLRKLGYVDFTKSYNRQYQQLFGKLVLTKLYSHNKKLKKPIIKNRSNLSNYSSYKRISEAMFIHILKTLS